MKGLLERIKADGVVCAEGFLFEIERRGYMASGAFVPEVVLENPQALKNLHKDFQHAGSDVVQAFTYNGHREKMALINKEHLLEKLNRQALQIAREVAQDVEKGEEQNLVAGNISNSNVWKPDNKEKQKETRQMFQEMIEWAVDEKADYIIGETFYYAEEAFAALDVAKKFNIPVVITIAPMAENIMRDGWKIVDTCKELEQRGADVVGMNCFRGPQTMLPYIKEIRATVKCPVAALPIAFRTTQEQPTFFSIKERKDCPCPAPHGRPFPTALDSFYVNRYEMRDFAETAWAMDVRYLGVCCGAAPIHIREVAETMGKNPKASKYKEDMGKHFLYGNDNRLQKHITDLGEKA